MDTLNCPSSARTQVIPSQVLQLTEEEQTFTFEGVASEPIPSLLRDMSAPVKLRYDYSDEDLAFLMKHDTDSFNRWESGQKVRWRLSRGAGVRRLRRMLIPVMETIEIKYIAAQRRF